MRLDRAFDRYLRHHRAEGSSPKTLEEGRTRPVSGVRCVQTHIGLSARDGG